MGKRRPEVTAARSAGQQGPRALAAGGSLPDDHRTLPERLEAAASGRRGVRFVSGSTSEKLSWAQLYEEAAAVGAVLQERGAGPRSRVALLGTTSRELVTAVIGSWLAGATVVVLPLPMRLGSLEEFARQTRARIQNAAAALLAVEPGLAPFVEDAGAPVLRLDEALRAAGVTGGGASSLAERLERPQISPGDLAVLQFTSGSTADPKGVMLPHSHVGAQVDSATLCAAFDAESDVMVSWLPLYHDMGLIGFLAVPACEGSELVIGSPQEFTGSPLRWMEWLSAFGATVTAGPSFAYALATRALRRASGLDFSRMRIALNGAEPVDPAAVEQFSQAAGEFGFPPGAVFCAFGMAEATLAVTFPEPGSGLRVDEVDAGALETELVAKPCPKGGDQRRLALLGRPLAGLELQVVDPDSGELLSERQVGEVEIRGSFVTPGYWRNPAATAAAFREGWLRTGDLGYLVDGELVLCGRRKDVIIVSGRNIFPEEAERAAGSVSGVRTGNVITFGVPGRKGREAVVVVAEVKEADLAQVRDEIAKRVRESLGMPPADIVLVPPSTLPKTSSGKLQRSLCRERYLSGALATVG